MFCSSQFEPNHYPHLYRDNVPLYLIVSNLLKSSAVTDLGLVTNSPYLTFIYRYKTHEFGYTKELTDNSHQKLHDIISKLKHQGLGYRKYQRN